MCVSIMAVARLLLNSLSQCAVLIMKAPARASSLSDSTAEEETCARVLSPRTPKAVPWAKPAMKQHHSRGPANKAQEQAEDCANVVAGDDIESGQEPLAGDVAINDFESSQDLLLGLGGEDGQVGTNACEGHTIMRKPCGAAPSSTGVMKRPAAALVDLPMPDLKKVRKDAYRLMAYRTRGQDGTMAIRRVGSGGRQIMEINVQGRPSSRTPRSRRPS